MLDSVRGGSGCIVHIDFAKRDGWSRKVDMANLRKFQVRASQLTDTICNDVVNSAGYAGFSISPALRAVPIYLSLENGGAVFGAAFNT